MRSGDLTVHKHKISVNIIFFLSYLDQSVLSDVEMGNGSFLVNLVGGMDKAHTGTLTHRCLY